MKKYFISLSIILCLILVGCGKKDLIIGTWEYEEKQAGYNITYEFNDDKTGSYKVLDLSTNEADIKEFTYKIKGNKILITYSDENDIYEQEYSVNENVLTLKDSFGEEYALIKK